MNRHNERAAASYDMPLSGNKLFVFLLVCLKTGISGCGSPFLIFLYRRSCVDTSASVKSFTLRIHRTN